MGMQGLYGVYLQHRSERVVRVCVAIGSLWVHQQHSLIQGLHTKQLVSRK